MLSFNFSQQFRNTQEKLKDLVQMASVGKVLHLLCSSFKYMHLKGSGRPDPGGT